MIADSTVPGSVVGLRGRLRLAACNIGIGIWTGNASKFFEFTVRNQAERGNAVIDTGPYAIVRHPGYFGAILTTSGMALSLGSLWALIPASFASMLLTVGTQWKDQMLQAELTGYKETKERGAEFDLSDGDGHQPPLCRLPTTMPFDGPSSTFASAGCSLSFMSFIFQAVFEVLLGSDGQVHFD